MNILEVIDWFIWEPVNTAHAPCCGYAIPVPEVVWNHVVFDHDVTIKVDLDDLYEKNIQLQSPVTVRKVIESIYGFYNAEINEEFKDYLINRYRDHDHYVEKVIEKLNDNQSVKWLELIGIDYMVIPPKNNERRHWASCSGHVRFEGLRETDQENVYEICLGS